MSIGKGKNIVLIAVFGLLSLLILPVIFLLYQDDRQVYIESWKFEIARHFSSLERGKCNAIRRMSRFSEKGDINYNFLKKDYPDISRQVIYQGQYLIFWRQFNYPKSFYTLDIIGRVPGEYIVAEIHEFTVLSYEPYNDLSIHHRVVYRKNSRGEYAKVDSCLKNNG